VRAADELHHAIGEAQFAFYEIVTWQACNLQGYVARSWTGRWNRICERREHVPALKAQYIVVPRQISLSCCCMNTRFFQNVAVASTWHQDCRFHHSTVSNPIIGPLWQCYMSAKPASMESSESLSLCLSPALGCCLQRHRNVAGCSFQRRRVHSSWPLIGFLWYIAWVLYLVVKFPQRSEY
jgi:hypothetical protein